MRKIVANTFVSLDGVMQAPGGPEEDPTGGFKHGGWSVNYWDDMMTKTIMDGLLGKPLTSCLAGGLMRYLRPTGRLSKMTLTSSTPWPQTR